VGWEQAADEAKGCVRLANDQANNVTFSQHRCEVEWS
jgi:hypothetical protein